MKQLLSIFILVLTTHCSERDPFAKALQLKAFPSFSILSPDSTTWISTGNTQAQKPVVIFFFSPHCPYCRAQMNDIITNINRLKNIQFYMISNFPMPDIQTLYTEYRMSLYPNIIVGKDTANYSGKYFNSPGVPFTAVFGKDKKPNKFFIGKVGTDQIQKAAEK